MPDLDDSDPPNFLKYVNTQVTLDMISTEELVQELINRENLVVMTAGRRCPRELYSKDKFYSAVRAILSCDLAKSLVAENMLGEQIIQHKDDLEFHYTIVVLRPNEERMPI